MKKGWAAVVGAPSQAELPCRKRLPPVAVKVVSTPHVVAAKAAIEAAKLVEINEHDGREMLESQIEASVYMVLAESFPKPLTAEAIVLKLQSHGRADTKDEVGDALYDGVLKNYVVRTGEPPNRLWELRTQPTRA